MKIATVTVIDNDILISVEKAIYQNVKCIKVNFKKNNSKYKNIEVFEKNNSDQVFVDTKSLIGKNVKVTCWDPHDAPGMWSKNNWFKDITFINQGLTGSRGKCIKCGLYIRSSSYTEDFGQSWMHYDCKDK